MPYIRQEDRLDIDETIDTLIEEIVELEMIKGDSTRTGDPEEPDLRNLDGVLNYTITRLLSGVLDFNKPRYTKFNTALGVLEGVKLELYRRRVAPYEESKILENGDVR